jgi:hypothetical protein
MDDYFDNLAHPLFIGIGKGGGLNSNNKGGGSGECCDDITWYEHLSGTTSFFEINKYFNFEDSIRTSNNG